MEKEFIPYEQVLALKKLGFDEEVEFYKDLSEEIFDMRTPNDAPCILWQQAFRWFRKKHEIEATTSCYYSKRLGVSYEEREYHCHIIRDGVTSKGPRYKTYEEAELVCLKKLISIVKEKQL